MRYSSIEELPFVCQLNLPEAAQHVYKDAYNRAWTDAAGRNGRDRIALLHAWNVVRERFERDALTGRWVPKTAALQPRVERAAAATRKRVARKGR